MGDWRKAGRKAFAPDPIGSAESVGQWVRVLDCRIVNVGWVNRLVADSLEADWNDKLRSLQEVQEQCQRQSQADRAMLDEKSLAEILSLACSPRSSFFSITSRNASQSLRALPP